MKYRPKIGTGDFDTKTRKVHEFLDEGHKVKITIMFRGREVAHPELGMKILDRIHGDIGPLAKVEAAPKLDGRNMVMVLAPDKRAQAAAVRAKAEAEAEAAAKAEAAAGGPAPSPDGASAPTASAPAPAPAPPPTPEPATAGSPGPAAPAEATP